MKTKQMLHRLIKAGYVEVIKIQEHQYKFVFTTPQGYSYVYNGLVFKTDSDFEYHILAQSYHLRSLYYQYFKT